MIDRAMRRSRLSVRAARVLGLASSVVLAARTAAAQQPPPLPAPAPPPAQYQPPPQPSPLPPPGYGQPPPPPSLSPQPYYFPQQPPIVTVPPEPETHAPKYSMWTGARLSYLGFGFSFYENERGKPETTGNFVGNGIAPQFDLGVRISYRYIPYIFWEHGFMGQGHRYEGSGARSATDFFGVGFRYVSGDVDAVAFLTDVSIGKRVIAVTNGTQSYLMSGIEFFRLGLGAEIRVATLFTLSPLFSVSSGALNDTDGNLPFTCARTTCPDGVTGPTYKNGEVIETARAYVVLSLGLGIHFDVFGK